MNVCLDVYSTNIFIVFYYSKTSDQIIKLKL